MNMNPRRWRLTAVGIVAVLATTVAHASSLGPMTSTSLNGFTGATASGAPTVYASDNFTGISGATLNGRALTLGGGTWTVAAGTWTISATGQAESNSVPLGCVVTATGRPDARIVVTVADSGQGGRTSGVVMRSDATASTFLSTYTENGSGGRIYLAKRRGTSSTTLVTFSGVTFTNPATFVVELNGANVKVLYNGATYINYTLSAADQATFGSLAAHGLLNDKSGTVRHDDFRVESL